MVNIIHIWTPRLFCFVFFFNSKQFICGIDFQFPMIMYTNGRFDVYVWLCGLFEMRVSASGFILFPSFLMNNRKIFDDSIWWLCGYFFNSIFSPFCVFSLLSRFLINLADSIENWEKNYVFLIKSGEKNINFMY